MKYKVSVIKLVTLVMIGALAVAMVACTGAATGPAGPPGEQGPPGPAAPTPETPTTDPAEPTEPAGPTGAAPVVSKPFTHVYLALEGTHNPSSKAIDLDMHITDADSQIKFSATSSDPMVVTAALPVNGRTVTIKPVRVGTATVMVEARDGDNPPTMADISVTVVRRNDRPTTNDLSKANRDALEKPLYVKDGPRPHTVTVVVTPGGTSSEAVEDEISDTFKVVVGKDDAGKDDYVSVTVTKSTMDNKYVITVNPKPTSLGKSSQMVKIYPMDMFGAMSSEAWEFDAMFNKTPKALIDRIPTIRLTRPATADIAAATVTTAGDDPSAATIEIADYFDSDSLQRMTIAGEITDISVAAQVATIDKVGDTVCAVTVSPGTLAVVQELNEGGAALVGDTDNVVDAHRRTGSQTLNAIRIDSRYSNLGSDNIVTTTTIADPPTVAQAPLVDTNATGEGVFDITIRCTDKDYTAEVKGTVVVQQG